MNKNKVIEKIINESLEKIMSDRFGKYSKYVIQQRALPDVRDGLKPVQRRILYSMFGLGLDFDKPYKKSARVVGDVIGKYHPHGDSSVYEAMVNMAQWWKSNVPLLDMHGNIGSIDDDPAAAMRYTEVRMSKITKYILNDIKKNTVTFAPNFDDSEIEPTVLPSIFPNILINGTKGIAIGMATEMPPHNLAEIIDASIFRIKNPKSNLEQILSIVKGPDFPTGGVIKGIKGIVEAFDKGRNEKEKIRLFAKYRIFEDKNNKYIEITEIPFGVIKSKLVYEIDMLINKKDIDGIEEIKDQSDRNGINILITLSKDANEQSILSYLMQKTQLQVTYSYNNVVIDQNSPKNYGILGLLDSYLVHVKEIKTKTLIYDLEKNKLRLEIVDGFIKVSEITDEVIEVIRNAEGSKAGVIEALIQNFAFTKNQATAIAELRLYRLSKTDKQAYLNEREELLSAISRIELLLNNEKEFNKFIIAQLKEIKDQFATERKTVIEEDEFDFSYEQTDLVKEEQVQIGISRFGYLKRISQKVAESNTMQTYALKEEDYLIRYNTFNTLNNLLIFTNLGNYAIVPIFKINESKWKDLGVHLSEFVNVRPDEEIVALYEVDSWDKNLFVVLGSQKGMFKKVALKEFEVSRINKKYTAMPLADNDKIVNATISDNTKDIVIITNSGYVTRYSENDIAQYSPKAKGNKGLYLSLNDQVANFETLNPDQSLAMLNSDRIFKSIPLTKIPYIPKNIKGKQIFKDFKINEKTLLWDLTLYNDVLDILAKDDEQKSYLDNLDNIYQKQDGHIKANIDNLIMVKFNKNAKLNFDPSQKTKVVQNIKEEKQSYSILEKELFDRENSLDELLSRLDKNLGKK
uniref:DNA topoisomerase (ATP-hydrolyzing) n=1 Tax=Mycoplasmopsis gallinacea TaxID=29556 RepID=A0A385GJ67_9BACT|nr:DNA topoisomerase IV subunit A [Mycoplasmopsis gallinacea]AXX39475.1 DNA topoisomerase IV subunit A [Mycoplasmopsis gallinacea]AXX39476.1 DNA topoisomerase IV subunit A [Mycoplasmopsis gallinacea]